MTNVSGSNNSNNEIKIIRTKEDLAQLKTSASNLQFLNSVFDELDSKGNKNGVLDENEGFIYQFEDGAISVMHNNKMYAGVAVNGQQIKIKETENEKTTTIIEDDTVQTKTTTKDNELKRGTLANGTTFEFEYNSKNELQYKRFKTADGKEYILSPDDRKFARIDRNGGIHTSPVEGDSFDGTMIRLGIKDPADIRAMKKANPRAARNGYFSIMADIDRGDVYIPPYIAKKLNLKYVLADNYNVDELLRKINSKPKKSETPVTEEEKAADKPSVQTETKTTVGVETGENARKKALEDFARQLIENGTVEAKAEKAIPMPGRSNTEDSGLELDETVLNNPKLQAALSSIPNDPAVAGDKRFAKYKKSLEYTYKRIAKLAHDGGWNFGDKPSEIPTDKKFGDEYANYQRLMDRIGIDKKNLESYIKEMKNWQDGPENSQNYTRRGPIQFNNLERITLKDGQHAWKSDRGVFYPHVDGKIGTEIVPRDLIP